MKIAIGADHRGYAHKQFLLQHAMIADMPIEWIDVGAHDQERSDYPEFAKLVAEKVSAGEVDRGILICGSGIGMAVAANRFSGVYAAIVWNEQVAKISREDDYSNVLVVPSDFVNKEQSLAMVDAWLHATFRGGRYKQRIDMID